MASLTAPAGSTQRLTILVLLVALVATVGGALGFEHIGGYIPCKLCLEQRLPYYAGIPLMAVALLAAWLRMPGVAVRALLLVGGLIMLVSLFLGIRHSGVEWGWWAGPSDCGAVALPTGGSGNGVLDQLDSVIPPSCDKAAWRDPVIALSFANWNAVISLVLAAAALRGAFARN